MQTDQYGRSCGGADPEPRHTMKLIKTPKDHATALGRLEELMLADPAPGSPGDEELELLAFLVEDYEKRTVRIPAATTPEAIRFRMEQAGLTTGNTARLSGRGR